MASPGSVVASVVAILALALRFEKNRTGTIGRECRFETELCPRSPGDETAATVSVCCLSFFPHRTTMGCRLMVVDFRESQIHRYSSFPGSRDEDGYVSRVLFLEAAEAHCA